MGLQKSLLKEDQFISCLKIPNPSLIEHQKVRAKIRFGFKVKGSSQLAVICTCLRMETQHIQLQTRFVQNTLVSPPMMFLKILNGKLAATKYAEYMKNIGLAFIFIIYIYIHIQGLECVVVISSTMSWSAALPNRSVIDNRDIKLWFIRNQMPFYIMKLDT